MQGEIQQEQPIMNNLNNYYFLNYNEKLSLFISNIIESYKNNKNMDISISSIFLDDELLNLIFVSLSKNTIYLNIIQVSQLENKFKEIELVIPENIKFNFGNIKLSEDKKHLVLFNVEKNKIFIIYDYYKKINLVNKIELDNFYENKKDKIIDIKFNKTIINNDIILYGINCDNFNLSIFSNKYINKEFKISFNEPYIDFQFVNNLNSSDLYIMNSYGNITFIKNINDIKNIPKSSNSDLFQKIKIYDKIVHNINIFPQISKCEYIKFYFQSQNDLNEKIKNIQNILCAIRITPFILEIGALINNKLFLFKKYCFNSNYIDNDNQNEIINEIIQRYNYSNQYLIMSDKNLYLLDISNFFNLSLPLMDNYSNNEQKKQDILIIINEIISKITLSKLLILPLEKNKNIFSITYNFLKGNIFFIKKKVNKDQNNINYIIKIYDIELDNMNLYNNNSNNFIIYDKNNNNQRKKEQIILMEDLLSSLIIEKDNLIKNEINSKIKGELCSKILEEFASNINNLFNTNNNKNIKMANYIKHINDWYMNLYSAIKLYGQMIQNKFDIINDIISKEKELDEKFKKDDDRVSNTMVKSIENKLKIIEENKKKLEELRNENNNLIYENYSSNINDNNSHKKFFSNELIKRLNNQLLNDINFIQDKFKNNTNNLNKLNFEQFNNFPLTMKYLNNLQKEKLINIINTIKKIIPIMQNFNEQIKNRNNK